MKDLLKRLFCIVMALTMVLCLVACGSTEEEEDTGRRGKNKETTEEVTADTEEVEETKSEEAALVGEWEAEIDMSDYMSDALYYAYGLELDVEDYIVVMTIEFDEDGTYKSDIDASKAEEAAIKMVDDMWPMLIEMYAELMGVSEAEVEAQLAAEGVSKESTLEEMDLQGAMDEAFENYAKGKWVLDGNELYMAKKNPERAEPIEIELDDDTMSFVGGDFTGVSDMDEYLLPIVFERA